jgi:hypothetical protein
MTDNNNSVPKKRGRKPKNIIKLQEVSEDVDISTIKIKRGRKPKNKNKIEENIVNILATQNITDSLSNDTAILKLHIDTLDDSKNEIIHKDENREKEFLNYTEEEIFHSPKGYEESSTFFSNPEEIIDFNINLENNTIFDINSNNTTRTSETVSSGNVILEDFIERDNWPIGTESACFWCCHTFNNTPYGIPFKYMKEKFIVYGCFCSLECAVAYNFSSQNNIYNVWENLNLINLLAHKLNYKDYVKCAPPREVLKLFGGYMNINQFREHCNSNKVLNILNYPMISSQHQVEEISEQSLNNNSRLYVPIDTDRIKKIEQKFKLIRQKPVLNPKNTLDHTMKLKIESN